MEGTPMVEVAEEEEVVVEENLQVSRLRVATVMTKAKKRKIRKRRIKRRMTILILICPEVEMTEVTTHRQMMTEMRMKRRRRSKG